jgi:hypothetical protein
VTRLVDLTGDRYGSWTVVEKSDPSNFVVKDGNLVTLTVF